jgi:hypothetical protein
MRVRSRLTKKATVRGTIKSRNGDLINVKDSKTGSIIPVNITKSTQIVLKKGAFKFRRAGMDVIARVPGLGIEAEGVGNWRDFYAPKADMRRNEYEGSRKNGCSSCGVSRVCGAGGIATGLGTREEPKHSIHYG